MVFRKHSRLRVSDPFFHTWVDKGLPVQILDTGKHVHDTFPKKIVRADLCTTKVRSGSHTSYFRKPKIGTPSSDRWYRFCQQGIKRGNIGL